jgi:hypothetical protein
MSGPMMGAGQATVVGILLVTSPLSSVFFRSDTGNYGTEESYANRLPSYLCVCMVDGRCFIYLLSSCISASPLSP